MLRVPVPTVFLPAGYATLLPLAGASANDDHAGLPSVDGLDMWPYLTGKVSESPRTEMMLSNQVIKGADKMRFLLLSRLYIETITLPRQAQDKRRRS
jgi:hypothetical protein